MNIKDLKEKETVALNETLAERRKHLFTLRSQAVTDKLEDPTQLGKTRRDIARIHTVLRQREIESTKAASK